MFNYSFDVKIINHIPSELLHIDGSNNWKEVKIIYGLLLVFGISIFYLFSQYFSYTPLYFRAIPLAFSLIIMIISFNKLLDGVKSNSLFEYLIFDEEGIRLNHTNDKSKEYKISIDKIKSLRIVVAESLISIPTFRFYLNKDEKPFTSFQYLLPRNEKLEQTINKFTKILKLPKTLQYRLTDNKILFEYKSILETRKQEIILPVNFEIDETPPRLIFRNIRNPKYHATLDFETGKLSAYSNLFYTIEIDFKDILKFENRIIVDIATQEHEGHFVSTVSVKKKNGTRNEILIGKIKYTDEPADILEFDCSRELDQITNQLNKILS